MNKLLVIVPVFNEECNIESVIKDIRSEIDFADILVVDDCSDDGTLEIVRKTGVNYLSLPLDLGYSSALQTGFKYAVERGFDYVLQFDGDGQHIASEAKKLYDAIREEDADIVLGSRFVGEASYEHSLLRKLGSRIFRILIRIICGSIISDPTSGLQILNRRVFEKYSKMHNYPDYPDANLLVEMLLNKYKILETPVEMRQRIYGTSMHSGFFRPIKYMVNMFYSIFIVIFRYIPWNFYLFFKRKR